MKIPALFFSISIFISIFPAFVYAETIDISPQPEYGDTIEVGTYLDSQGKIEGEIGPKLPNQLKFPDLSKEEDFYSKEAGLFNTLPQSEQQSLNFKDPARQEIKDEKNNLGGEIAHPLCGKAKLRKDDGKSFVETETTDPIIKSSPVSFTPTEDFFQTILRTRFWQSILVPQKGSDLNFNITSSKAVIPDKKDYCVPDKSGKPVEIVTIENAPPAKLDFFGGLFKNILDFIKDFLAGKFGGAVQVTAKLEQTKYLPGETVLSDQTVGNNGFLNFFKPEGAQFTNQGDEKEKVTYRVLKEDRENTGVTYKGVSSLKGGTLDLVKSLYPEGMAPESLAEITTAPPQGNLVGYIPPGPLATGLPDPKSKELENLIKSAATAFGVPIPVLSAVAWTESWHQNRGMWDYMDEEILRYSAAGAQSPLNPQPNGCRAAGPMQFIIGGVATDCGKYTGQDMSNIWSSYANAVNEAARENRTPDYRNIKDTIYAAAKKLKEGSGTPRDDIIWNESTVRSSISAWYGSCQADSITQARFGPGKGFCDFVWDILVASRQGIEF